MFGLVGQFMKENAIVLNKKPPENQETFSYELINFIAALPSSALSALLLTLFLWY
jgi:hypothetical protein